MLKTILSISGKPGLYELISQGKNVLIVEAIGETKKRIPIHAREKITSLADIGMYTNGDEVPLYKVFDSMKQKEEGKPVNIDLKTTTADELKNYLTAVLPDFDRDRVHVSDIKKLIQWYNILVNNGITDFLPETKEEAESADSEA